MNCFVMTHHNTFPQDNNQHEVMDLPTCGNNRIGDDFTPS